MTTNIKKEEETSLVPTIVEPAVPDEKIVDHMRRFKLLKSKLLSKDDVVIIQNKPYVKRSGWRKLALAFNISDEIVRAEKEDLGESEYVWRIWVKCTAPNGRTSFGVGSCSSKEREKFAHEEHDIYAIAHTRAKNRAISDLIGSGEVSAEEIQGLSEIKTEQPIETKTPTSTTQPIVPSKPVANKTIKWSIKGEDFPIPNEGEQARPYIGLVRNKLMRGLSEKYGIIFEEEVVGGFIVSIKSSSMEEKQWNEFYDSLEWALCKSANCGKNDVKIWVE